MKFLNQTKVVIPVLLGLLFLFSFLLYRNITKSGAEGSNPTIGVLSFKNRTIQRKFDGEVVWETIPTETPIRNRDTIRTEDLSDATLTLEDGTKIDIGENSMILVDFSDKQFNLNFAYGSVGAKKGEGDAAIVIQSGDSSVSIGSGELSLNKVGDKLDVSIAEGEAQLKVGDEEKSLEKNQTANVTKDGLEVKNQTFILESPKDRSIIVTDKNTMNVNFSWKNLEEKKQSLTFLLSTDLGFRKITQRNTVSQSSVLANLRPGNYYWKLDYKNREGKTTSSSIHRFTLLEKPRIKLYTPANNSNTIINLSNPSPISFAWSQMDSVSRYIVEISNDSNFSQIIESKETKSSSIGFLGLKEGNYYYRVTAKSSIPGMDDSVSETRTFRLSERQKLDPPKLIEPTPDKSIPSFSIPENGILFSCKDQLDWKSYKFQIANDSDFSRVIKEENSNRNFFRWSPGDNDTGIFYWRVTASSQTGESLSSNIQKFQITEKVELKIFKPESNEDIDLPDNGKINFSWKALPSQGKAKLYISNKNDFSSLVLEMNVKGSGAGIKMPGPGVYYSRLEWERAGQKSESDVVKFQLTTPLDSPKISLPRAGQQVDMTEKEDLLLEWSKVANAESYLVRLLDVTGLREREILNTSTKSTSIRFKELTKLNQGKFRLEVRALDKLSDGTKIESKPSRVDFFISLKTGITTKILTPEKIYVE